MTGRRFSGLFESLEAGFAAAEARAERDAAEDLALSLRQDRSLSHLLARAGWCAELSDARPAAIRTVGRDYVATADTVIPFSSLIAIRAPHVPPPEVRDDGLRECLRRWVRHAPAVELSAAGRLMVGTLVAAARDHLIVHAKQGEKLVPYALVERIIRRGNSADAL